MSLCGIHQELYSLLDFDLLGNAFCTSGKQNALTSKVSYGQVKGASHYSPLCTSQENRHKFI